MDDYYCRECDLTYDRYAGHNCPLEDRAARRIARKAAVVEAKRAEEAAKLAAQTTNWSYKQPFPLAKD